MTKSLRLLLTIMLIIVMLELELNVPASHAQSPAYFECSVPLTHSYKFGLIDATTHYLSWTFNVVPNQEVYGIKATASMLTTNGGDLAFRLQDNNGGYLPVITWPYSGMHIQQEAICGGCGNECSSPSHGLVCGVSGAVSWFHTFPASARQFTIRASSYVHGIGLGYITATLSSLSLVYWGEPIEGCTVSAYDTGTPFPTPTATATAGPSPTPTDTNTPGPSPSPTNTGTPSPSSTPTKTRTPAPTLTPWGTPTSSPSYSGAGFQIQSFVTISDVQAIVDWIHDTSQTVDLFIVSVDLRVQTAVLKIRTLSPIPFFRGALLLFNDFEWLMIIAGWFIMAALTIIAVVGIRLLVALWGPIQKLIELIKLIPGI